MMSTVAFNKWLDNRRKLNNYEENCILLAIRMLTSIYVVLMI